MIGILCSENSWMVEQLQLFLNKQGIETRLLLIGKEMDLSDIDYVIVRGGPGIKNIADWKRLIESVEKIEEKGISCINSSEAIKRGLDKYATYLLLRKNNISTPATYLLSEGIDSFPAIAKPIMGSEGEGIVKIENKQELEQLKNEQLLVQEFIPHGGVDYRAYVIGGRVVGAISRRAKNSWITNIAKGGVPEKYVMSEETEKIVKKASEAVHAEIATVDFAIINNRGKEQIHVFEVNVLPLFSKALEELTGFNLAEEIIKYSLGKYSK
jgi:RimK family alpha-L-glutamate ligase